MQAKNEKSLFNFKIMLYNVFVAPKTSNLYGKISISNKAIKHVVTATSSECYGVAWAKAGKLNSENNRISLSVDIYLKFGVSIDPVIESIRRAVKYNVESFTGMIVEHVNINVLGIKS